MKQIIFMLAIALLSSSSLLAKESYFNPYEPEPPKVIKKPSKLSIKEKKRVKTVKKKSTKVTKVKKWVKKVPKRKSVKVNRRLSLKLDEIYKKVLKKTDINRGALKKAFSFYKKNRSKKALSSKYLAIADYTKSARSKRLYIINLRNGTVHKHKVAHGKRSGSVGGKVRRSSNRRSTNMTPYGFFKVGSREGRTKKKGHRYLSVKGLERSNRKVGHPSRWGGRDVVMHTAKYVNSGGRSHGCFAIRPQDRYRVFSKLKKALLYSYTGR
ncbi:L,D-transpeptidase family protein [Sulfurovum sp. bin170]|uniref:murein L,D-transpeptidase catalytic domain-containing protein n=1 Tax=Sulfurovum sp. bin170 TaxID=2695268 RepID=UPI0013E076F6|nr:murein L,D-transpeptidase catalytic domain family protein [Sulfurovum sp. bin170]NEW60929.1 L,D-transpeptidase family protein [Sulfurovum sp. bin170]